MNHRNYDAVAIPCLLLMASCAASPEQTSFEIADGRARWLDRFHADEIACRASGGHIVQERHSPDSIRVGEKGPEIGTRYWCAR